MRGGAGRESVSVGVFGADRKGVVAAVTQFIFQRGGNIEELVEQVTRREFHMTLVASWPAGRVDRDALKAGLAREAARLKMEATLRWHVPGRRLRMAVLVTRELEPLRELIKAVRAGSLKVEPVLIASNHATMAPLARRYRLPFVLADYRDRDASERRLLAALERHEADFVVLARFMRILSPRFAWRYRNRIINVHPSLLPAFPGAAAYRQAYEHGVKVVGATAHFVTPDLDGGPIIAQGAIHLRAGESLDSIAARGRRLEARVLLKAVRRFVANRLDVAWGKVREL